jgi:iron complex outermembrane recepter protein
MGINNGEGNMYFRKSDEMSVNRKASMIGKLALLPAAVMALGALGTPTQAQEGEATKARAKIENVTVTARKREELSQSVPLAMTALTAELRKPTVRNLSDLNGFSANVRIDSDESRGGGLSIQIRGISPSRIDDNSLDAPIAVMIDGVHLGSLAGQLLENFDLERIEILRGPQGTLFGKNTVGGAISVVRSRPTGEWGAKLKYTIGKWGQQEVRTVFNIPAVEDKLAIKGFFTYIHSDGYIKNEFLDTNVPKTDYKNYGMTFLFTPSDNFEALLTIERYEDDGHGGGNITNWNLAPGVATAPTDPREPDYSGGFLNCFLPNPPFTTVPCRTDLAIPKTTASGSTNPGRLRTTAMTLNMRWDLNDNMSIVSVTGHRKMTEDRFLDFDGTEVNHITIDRDNDFKQFSQEVRFEGAWDNFSVVAGAYYWRSEFTQDWITGGDFWNFVSLLGGYSLQDNVWLSPALADLSDALLGGVGPTGACIDTTPNPAGGLYRDLIFGNVQCDSGAGDRPYGPNHPNRLQEHQITESIALFAQAEWEFIENWTLTAGLRYTEETKDFEAGQAYIFPLDRLDVINFPSEADLDNKWTEMSPKFGISWQATDDVLLYGSYSEGFHSGGFFGVNQNVADFERDQYNPEFANSWEVGVKSQVFDNTLQLNLTLFRNNFKDKQESSVQFDASTNTVATVFSNVGSAVYQGVELEMQWVATSNLNFFGTVGILDANYTEFETDLNPNDDALVGALIEDATHLTPRNAPKLTWGVGGTYTIPVGNDGEFDIYAKFSRISSIEGSLINTQFFKIGPRNDLVASLSYTWDKYRVTVYGKNLTDEVNEFPAIIAPLFASGTINAGRSWGVELQGEF